MYLNDQDAVRRLVEHGSIDINDVDSESGWCVPGSYVNASQSYELLHLTDSILAVFLFRYMYLDFLVSILVSILRGNDTFAMVNT